MGESFKSLTIQIAGDTTKLQKSLKLATSVARNTEQELRKIGKGLKMDPTSLSLTGSKLSELSAKAEAVGEKLAYMQRQFDRTGFGADGLKRDADAIKQIYEDTLKANDAYNKCNAQLERLNRKYANLSEANAKAMEGIAFDKEDWKPALLKLQEIGQVTSADIREFKALKKEHHELQAQLDKAKEVEAFHDLEVSLGATRAEMAKLAAETVEVRQRFAELDVAEKHLNDLRENASRTDSMISALAEDEKRLSKALKIDPRDFASAVSKMENLKVQSELAADKLTNLRAQAARLRQQGFGSVEAGKLEGYLAACKDDAIRLEVQFKEADARARMLSEEFETLKAKSGVVTDEMVKVKAELDMAKENAKELRVEWVKCNDALGKLQGEKMLKDIELEAKEAADAMRELEVRTKSAGSAAKMSWSGLITAGRTLTQNITPLLSMFMAKTVDAADTIDSAYRDMRKTVNGTESDFVELRQAAIDFSKTSVVSADTILEIEAMGGQLGIASESLGAFAETVSNLDIATNMDSDEIAEMLGKLQNILGMTTDEFSRFGDALVRLGNNEPALEGDVMNITNRFAGMAKIVGMSGDEMLGWATAATATGQKAEAAGSAMQRFLSNAEGAVNKGGASLKEWAKVAGMSSKEFKESFKNDVSGTLYKFIEGLGKMQSSGKSVNQELKDLGINNVRDKQLIEGLAMQMANATDETNVLRDSLEMSKAAWNGQDWVDGTGKIEKAGDASREAARKSEGFSGAFKRLQNIFTAFSNDIGSTLAPAMQNAADILADLETSFEHLPSFVKQGIVGVTAFGAALGPGLTLIGGMAQGMKSVADFTQKFGDAERRVARIQRAANTLNLASAETEALLNMARDTATKKEKMLMRATLARAAAVNAAKVASGAMVASLVLLAAYAGYKAYERMMNLNKATNDLRNAQKSAASTSEELGKAISNGDSYKDAMGNLDSLSRAYDDLIEKQITMAQGIKDSFSESAAGQDQLAGYFDTIKELAGSTDVDDLGKMRTAIKGINEACGTSYYIDEATGKIREQGTNAEITTKKLGQLVDAQKREMQAEVLQSAVNEVLKQRQQITEELAKAEKGRAEAIERMARADEVGDNDTYFLAAQDAKMYEEKVNGLQESLDACNDSIASYEGQMNLANTATLDSATKLDKYIDSLDVFKASFTNGFGVDQFADDLKGLGIKVNQFKKLQSEDLGYIAERYDGTKQSIVDALREMGAEIDTVDGKKIDPKTFTVKDDGTLKKVKWDFEKFGGLPGIKKDVKFDDKGTAKDVKEDYSSIAKKPDIEKDVKFNAVGLGIIEEAVNRLKNTTVKVKASVSKHASGGLIPMHAAGGALQAGIYTRATMTDVGIVGEDGAEAWLPGPGGSGVLAPLTNRRYVKPFAQAVAAEMKPGGGSVQNVSVVLDYKAGSDANAIARDIALALKSRLRMEG